MYYTLSTCIIHYLNVLYIIYMYYTLFFRVSETVTFSYVLKTDDDCFLSIHRILNKLETYKGVTKLWWGR